MSCCGQSRRSIGRSAGPAPTQPSGRATLSSTTELEYVGATGLTVVGPATGRRYRFDRPGARLPVALPDRWGLLQVPNLREVGG
jgi:hypothetical protein